MGKGANKQLLSNSGAGQARSNQQNNRANDVYGTLDPALVAEATNPQGYGAKDLAAINTADQQSLGGSTAGVTGQANLEAARTRNAGGFQGAIGSASRANARQLSQNALGVQEQNANLKEAQRQQALSSLQSLYGVDENTALQYLNSSNDALGKENVGSQIANQDFWNSFNKIAAIAGGAASGAGGGGGGGGSD